ncbi:MAG: hypothetical protein LBI14_10385 [Treponema sp.]|jgi:hypothetical protein|nr:hypothetical protein [Treponema sp.]
MSKGKYAKTSKYTSPREKELVGKVFTDEEGRPYQGQRFILRRDESYVQGFEETGVCYRDGKIHGSPAIEYHDGLKEEWENGNFIKVLKLPYAERN